LKTEIELMERENIPLGEYEKDMKMEAVESIKQIV